jgi:OmpA-OmpF porin, OOP family
MFFGLRTISSLIVMLSFLSLTGCSTPPEAKLESDNPKDAISEVAKLRGELLAKHTDVIAPEPFQKGTKNLKEAIADYKDQEEAKETMDKVTLAKSYFVKAQNEASSKSQIPNLLFESRTKALDANVRYSKDLNKELASLDNDVYEETDGFTKDLSSEEFANFQRKYIELEVKSVQYKELQVARHVVSLAESKNAKHKASMTLTDAKTSIANAETMIASNVSEPQAYNESVIKANKDAKLLDDVMKKMDEMGEGTSEKVALTLVDQDRKIGKLSDNISDLKINLFEKNELNSEISQELNQKSTQLKDASSQVQFQKAMDKMRRNFSNDEAAVYQQGQNLIIRLKKINFAVGSSKLPTESMDLLSKVRSIVSKLDAEQVVVEGHTDSTGSDALNQKISSGRAESVAKYLSSTTPDVEIRSVGYGETKPLETNNTKKGRALNRRVDIVVTAKR